MTEVNRVKQSFRSVLALLAFSLFSLTLFIMPGVANAASNSLAFTPTKNYTIKPGGNVSDSLYISNLDGSSALTLSLRVIDFSGMGETGTPALDLSTTAKPTTWSLKPFLTVPQTITVPAGGDVYAPITIHIPANQGAGSYYSAVEYSANVGTKTQSVALSASGASLIFVTVPGQTNEILNLKKFGAYIPGANGAIGNFSTWFFSKPPTQLGYLLDDQGNVAEQPVGSIVIKNMFGKVTQNITEANPNDDLVLIGQTRLFNTCIQTGQESVKGSTGQTVTQTVCAQPKMFPGVYTANLDIFYAQNGSNAHEINAVSTFWYLPAWFIIAFVVVVAIIILIIFWIVRKIRHLGRKRKAKKTETPMPPTPPVVTQ